MLRRAAACVSVLALIWGLLAVSLSEPNEVNTAQAASSTQSEPGLGEVTLTLQVGSPTLTIQEGGRTQIVTLDAAPVLSESRTFLPIRPVVEALGGSILWEPGEQRVDITNGPVRLRLWIGKSGAEKNGVPEPIDPTNASVKPYLAPPGRTMLPLRFVAESLGAEVSWSQSTGTITITIMTSAAVQGCVVNALSGKPLAGASVTCGQDTVATDSAGGFCLPVREAGTVTLQASASGFQPSQLVYHYQPGSASRALLALWPEAGRQWEITVPEDGGCTANIGEGFTLTLPTRAVPAGTRLLITEYEGGSPGEGMAVTIARAYDISLGDAQGGQDAPLQRPAVLEFEVPSDEDAARALILSYHDDAWYVTVDPSGDVFGGELGEDGRTISIEVDHFSRYAIAFVRPDAIKGTPVHMTVESQRLNADGNLEVAVLIEQPRHPLGFFGTWFRVTVEEPLNLISVTCPTDGFFKDGVGYLGPGETKRLIFTFYGCGGTARIHCSMTEALGMITVDWLCRLASGENLPWPITADNVFAGSVEQLLKLAGEGEWVSMAKAAFLAATSSAPGSDITSANLGQLVDILGENVAKYFASGYGLHAEDFCAYLEEVVRLPKTQWASHFPQTVRAWRTAQAATVGWALRFIRTTDLCVTELALIMLGWAEDSYHVVTATWPEVAVEPAQITVSPGATAEFRVTVTDPDGNPVSYPRVEWTVDGGGWIDSRGQFHADSTSTGTYTVTASITGTNFSGEPHEFTGQAEVLIASEQTEGLELQFNRVSLSYVPTDPWSLVAGDFTGDGLPDLAISEQGAWQVTILENMGYGRFAVLDTIEPLCSWHVATGYFDGDTLPDLLIEGTGYLSVALNEDGRGFGNLELVVGAEDLYFGSAVIDVDADGTDEFE